MTFLQHYGLGAVGFTMLITTLVVQWSIVVEGIFLVLSDTDAHSFPMKISFLELIDGNFAAAAVLISFGALIGKVGPTQVLALAMLEVVVYAANKRFLMMELIGIADIGGTVVIHVRAHLQDPLPHHTCKPPTAPNPPESARTCPLVPEPVD